MGQELEIKLHVEDERRLEAVWNWEALAALRIGAPYDYRMETTYFDTPTRTFSERQWTVRRRMENGRSVFCVKTPRNDPAHPLLRGEWEVEADSADAAFPLLVQNGAPAALAEIDPGTLVSLCAARFTRRAQLLRLSETASCELACDAGVLLGGGREQPFFELELERKTGDEEALYAFAQLLMAHFGLRPEPKSKLARARALAE